MDPAFARVMELVRGGAVSQAISVVAELGVADELVSGPRSVEELAGAVGAHGPTLYRLLRVLADYGLFEELEGLHFALAPAGQSLRSDVPRSLRNWSIMMGQPFYHTGLTGVLDAVRTGEPAFDQAYGQSVFAYLQEHPDAASVFDAAMVDISREWIAPVVEAYDFGSFRRVVDVGGGTGALLAAILSAHPAMRGVLFDQPHVLDGAHRLLDEAGVSDRCELVAGDFFDSVPPGGDAYVLANIIHDWDDEQAVQILRTCRAAIGAEGRVLLAEAVLPDRPVRSLESTLVKLMDLGMLVLTSGGRQRTRTEYRELLRYAGLRLAGVAPAGVFSIVDARGT